MTFKSRMISDAMLARLKDLWTSEMASALLPAQFDPPVSIEKLRYHAVRSLGLPSNRTWAKSLINSPMPRAPWPLARDARLKEMYNRTHSAEEIASILTRGFPNSPPVSRNAVIGRAKRLGLSGPFFRVASRESSNRLLRKVEYRPRIIKRVSPKPGRVEISNLTPVNYLDFGFTASTTTPRTPRVNHSRAGDRVVSKPNLISGGCRCIVGTDLMADDFYCGREITRGSYCAEHAERMYAHTRIPTAGYAS